MEQKTQLEVGDYLYINDRWAGLKRYQVEKVTAKQAIAGTKKVYREITIETMWKGQTKAVVKIIGEYGSLYIETPELKEEYETNLIVNTAFSLLRNIKSLSKEQALQIIAILSPETDETKTI